MCTRLRIYTLTDYVFFFSVVYAENFIFFYVWYNLALLWIDAFSNVYKNLHFSGSLKHIQYSLVTNWFSENIRF